MKLFRRKHPLAGLAEKPTDADIKFALHIAREKAKLKRRMELAGYTRRHVEGILDTYNLGDPVDFTMREMIEEIVDWEYPDLDWKVNNP